MRRLVSVAALWVLSMGPAAAAVLITIDKAEQRMTVEVDGEARHSWPVSTGRSGYDTPSGAYAPFRMERTHFSKEWDDAPMPHSIFFTRDGHAIHGTDAARQLGAPASHGCVRLSRGNAARLFALVAAQGMKETRVVIEGDDPIRAAPRAPEARAEPWDEDDRWSDVDPLTRQILGPPAVARRAMRETRARSSSSRQRSAPSRFWD